MKLKFLISVCLILIGLSTSQSLFAQSTPKTIQPPNRDPQNVLKGKWFMDLSHLGEDLIILSKSNKSNSSISFLDKGQILLNINEDGAKETIKAKQSAWVKIRKDLSDQDSNEELNVPKKTIQFNQTDPEMSASFIFKQFFDDAVVRAYYFKKENLIYLKSTLPMKQEGPRNIPNPN